MRITNSMMVNKFLTDSNDALNRVSKYQSQVDSTKRITNIADDPEAALKALKARNRLSNLGLYKSNISTANSYLTEAESSVSGLNEVLKTAYEQIVSAQSGSKTAEDKKAIAEELKNLQAEVISIANTSLGTSYIFGGYNYTGTISAGTKTPPFTVNSTTGDLEYNGINMSKFSWVDEFKDSTSQMKSLEASIKGLAASFTASSGEEYAKQQSQQILSALDGIVASADKAMTAAKEFDGSTTASTEYINFKNMRNSLSSIASSIRTEVSKELVNGETGLPSDELANRFSASKVLTILDGLVGTTGLFTGTPTATDPSPMDATISGTSGPPVTTGLDSIVKMTTADETLLTDETNKKTILQIGTSQTVEVTITGPELLGAGKDNLYHLLGQAISLLENDANATDLGQTVTAIQKAQSSVLTLDTRIGSTKNRMTLMSDRYGNSELNYTKMRSDAEDADMAESILNLTTAQSVYNAALAGGAQLIKTSLMDFLR